MPQTLNFDSSASTESYDWMAAHWTFSADQIIKDQAASIEASECGSNVEDHDFDALSEESYDQQGVSTYADNA
ncbi:hypothetical protein D9757_012775 [Collybiopsis confluens]|uniref:Uncharacterized protein n=1 Tax=Collybiopsis confluens TaxID=2823264 RepID=A0A8H5GKE3_9AGAR|nr:hypothetical protein D9757_012775 [Collybiopsis confluens]